MANQQSPRTASVSSPSVPQKRVMPARERRESVVKREASSPIAVIRPSSAHKSTPSKATPKTTLSRSSKRKIVHEATPPPPSPAPAIEEPLPTKITDAKPLPTSNQPQAAEISLTTYQSVAESAVLAASLYRSRTKWLAEGIFEKYWTKPSKKKGAEVVPNNPDLKSMQKLGSSTVTIGPHAFDAIVYTVRDSVAYRQPNQQPPRPVPLPQSAFQPSQLEGAPVICSQFQPRMDPRMAAAGAEVKKEKSPSGSVLDPRAIVPNTLSLAEAQPSTEPSSTQAAEAPPSGPDPVIQMLAARAATNPELKALMKIVASSQASPEQLKLFQSHIDQLNAVLRQRHETERPLLDLSHNQMEESTRTYAQTDGSSDDQARMSHMVGSGVSASLSSTGSQQSTQHIKLQHRPVATANQLEPTPHTLSHHHYPLPPQKVPIAEPLVKAIVLELTSPASAMVSASQDRYLFPEYAVLDTVHGRNGLEMICSFLVTRSGADLLASQSADEASTAPCVGGLACWKTSEDYYQPVTMTLKTSQPRVFETIARAAKPLQEVQMRMREVMQSKTRVKDEWLVLRLPREKGVTIEALSSRDVGFVDSAVEMEDDKAGSGDEDDDELKAFYGF